MGRLSVVALALSLAVGCAPCASATLYTIPGTTQQIDFQNNSDPQFQLSDDEINQILNALSPIPPSQLAHLKIFKVLPPILLNQAYPVINATSDTAFSMFQTCKREPIRRLITPVMSRAYSAF